MESHVLLDGVKMNTQHPSTFHIPSENEKQAIRTGDNVKLCFQPRGAHPLDCNERMWVTVTELIDEGYKGVINNDPVSPSLKDRQEVEFEAKHIIGIFAE